MIKAGLLILSVCMHVWAMGQTQQPVLFKSGTYQPEKNLEAFIATPGYTASELVNGNYFRLIQFEHIPTNEQKTILKNAGIELLEYVPRHTFYASIKKDAHLQTLQTVQALSVFPVNVEFKLTANLKNKNYPAWALVNENTIQINAVYYSTISPQQVLTKLVAAGWEVTMSNDAHIIRFNIPVTQLNTVYNWPEFYYFETIDAPPTPEGTEDRSAHRSNYINTRHTSGLHFDGSSITVMLQDNSLLDDHIDYTGRFFHDASASQDGDHGEHCGGIIAGAGNRDPKGEGMAPGADVLVFDASDNNFNDVPGLYNTSNVTITSKSYSNGTNAGYTSLARQLDEQSRQMPALIHVFSAGNAGSGFSTITGGHKQAKNVIAVANVSYTDVVASSSSRGPAEDGRLKPDISAVGSSVYSTVDPNGYQSLSGTSMACPGIAGVLAQLYEGYKATHAGNNPNAALMKSMIMNTADDLGNVGPDYLYGWGRVNARRAFNAINNNQYITSAISQGGNNSHVINVPVGTTQLRVMVYWTDYEGVTSASPALVNDLDMEIDNPSLTTFFPWLLNPLSPGTPASTGADHLNNVEQVVISNPAAGNYTVHVNGFAIPQGPQEYYLVYEFLQDEVVVTYPLGGEGLDPGTVETIRWDSYGGTGTFLVEYSTNNGSSWNTINASVGASVRHVDWTVPTVVTGDALVRVTRGVVTDVSDDVFSIMDAPLNLDIDWACPDSMQLSWSPVTGATMYEIYKLGNKYMDSVGVTSSTSYTFYNTNPTVSYWYSVRALAPALNAHSERAIAVEKAPGIINCPIAIDATLSNVNPPNNAQYQSCLVSTIDVTIGLLNSGQSTLNNIPVHYILNGGAAVSEIFAGPLAPGATATHTFSTTVSPLLGMNQLLIWSDLSGDGNPYNDTVQTQFNYIFAPVQNLPWSDDFENFGLCGTSSNCEVEICALTNGFMNETNGTIDDIDWRTDENGTPTNNSGPAQDFNPGDTTGNYLYLEASGGCNGQVANLVSPCIDLSGANAPGLQFAYHMYGDDMGSLLVDVFANGVYTNIFTMTGDQGDAWFIHQQQLTAFLGETINIRVRGITGPGSQSDLAIDDIKIIDGLVINEETQHAQLMVYPNPGHNQFTVTMNGVQGEIYTVNVFNTLGEHVREDRFNHTVVLNSSQWQTGMYFIQVSNGQKSWMKKVVKN